MYRLLIVDDEKVIADGLSEVFRRFDMELKHVKLIPAMRRWRSCSEAMDISFNRYSYARDGWHTAYGTNSPRLAALQNYFLNGLQRF